MAGVVCTGSGEEIADWSHDAMHLREEREEIKASIACSKCFAITMCGKRYFGTPYFLVPYIGDTEFTFICARCAQPPVITHHEKRWIHIATCAISTLEMMTGCNTFDSSDVEKFVDSNFDKIAVNKRQDEDWMPVFRSQIKWGSDFVKQTEIGDKLFYSLRNATLIATGANFILEKILQSGHIENQLMFHVKWEGFSEKYLSWETYESISNSDAVATFLRQMQQSTMLAKVKHESGQDAALDLNEPAVPSVMIDSSPEPEHERESEHVDENSEESTSFEESTPAMDVQYSSVETQKSSSGRPIRNRRRKRDDDEIVVENPTQAVKRICLIDLLNGNYISAGDVVFVKQHFAEGVITAKGTIQELTDEKLEYSAPSAWVTKVTKTNTGGWPRIIHKPTQKTLADIKLQFLQDFSLSLTADQKFEAPSAPTLSERKPSAPALPPLQFVSVPIPPPLPKGSKGGCNLDKSRLTKIKGLEQELKDNNVSTLHHTYTIKCSIESCDSIVCVKDIEGIVPSPQCTGWTLVCTKCSGKPPVVTFLPQPGYKYLAPRALFNLSVRDPDTSYWDSNEILANITSNPTGYPDSRAINSLHPTKLIRNAMLGSPHVRSLFYRSGKYQYIYPAEQSQQLQQLQQLQQTPTIDSDPVHQPPASPKITNTAPQAEITKTENTPPKYNPPQQDKPYIDPPTPTLNLLPTLEKNLDPDVFFGWIGGQELLGFLRLDLSVPLKELRKIINDNQIVKDGGFVFVYKNAPVQHVQEAILTARECTTHKDDSCYVLLKPDTQQLT